MVRYTFNRFEDANFAHTDYLPGWAARERGSAGKIDSEMDIHRQPEPRQRSAIRSQQNQFSADLPGSEHIDTFSSTDTFGRGVDYFLRASRDLAASCSTGEMDRNDSAAPTRAVTT